jgi:hypothetical protein
VRSTSMIGSLVGSRVRDKSVVRQRSIDRHSRDEAPTCRGRRTERTRLELVKKAEEGRYSGNDKLLHAVDPCNMLD